MNRTQLQKCLSTLFLDRHKTAEQCEQTLVATRWPSEFVGPACGATESRTTSCRGEADDVYARGQRSGRKTGRGLENKVPFVAAVQTTEDGQPLLTCLSPRPLNSLISNINTAPSGTDHSVKFAKYAHRHLAEGQFRVNPRYDLHAILGCLACAMVVAPPSPGRRSQVAEHRH